MGTLRNVGPKYCYTAKLEIQNMVNLYTSTLGIQNIVILVSRKPCAGGVLLVGQVVSSVRKCIRGVSYPYNLDSAPDFTTAFGT